MRKKIFLVVLKIACLCRTEEETRVYGMIYMYIFTHTHTIVLVKRRRGDI